MIDRINLILRTKNLSASQFADEINIQRSSISHILSGRNNPSLEFMMKVLTRFPELETDWLIFGKGSMYKTPTEILTTQQNLPIKKLIDMGVQKDLFSAEGEISEIATVENNRDEEKKAVEISVNPNRIETNIAQKNEIFPTENTIKEFPKKQEPFDSILKQEKKHIEKFVVLYSDNTFAEYFPEKK